MAYEKLMNRVREIAAAPGTGTVTLLGAAVGHSKFSDRLSNGDRCRVTIADTTGANWEVILATYTAGTLTRSAGDVEDGSAGPGVLVNFSSGVQDVWLDGSAGFLRRLQGYVHEQLVAATTWTINHTLNKYPSVTVVDSGGTMVYGEVNYVSDSQLTVSFSAAFSGKAYLN